MKKLQLTRLGNLAPFTIHAGENARGIRLKLRYTKGLEVKNFIKIKGELFETDVENITEDSVDIIFPNLDAGTYEAEIAISEGEEVLKSGIYNIVVEKSIISGEANKLKSVNADEILVRLIRTEEELRSKIKDLDILKEGVYDKAYEYTQSTASDTWIINHNLNKYPSITVVDSGGNQVYGDVKYLNKNTVELKYSYPFSGTAFFN